MMFKPTAFAFMIFVSIISFSGCKSPPSTENISFTTDTAEEASTLASLAPFRSPEEVSVMTFNVENMFDNIHNDGVGDYPYLPKNKKKASEVQKYCERLKGWYRQDCFNKNWDDMAVKFKLSQVARIITFVDKGEGPDNLLLVEIENENILNDLVKNHLKGLGYQTVSILKGPDLRGINTAFISKFPLVGKPVLHLIPYTDPASRRSRGILEVTVKIHNKNVTFLSAHFPSQKNENTMCRREAIEFMTTLMLKMQNDGRAVIAGGDLNTIAEEESVYGYFSRTLSQAGPVSHLVGCKKCQGTHNYNGGWDFLDVLVFSKNLSEVAGLKLIPQSIAVVKSPYHVNSRGYPVRFDEERKRGVSDHLPLYARLQIVR